MKIVDGVNVESFLNKTKRKYLPMIIDSFTQDPIVNICDKKNGDNFGSNNFVNTVLNFKINPFNDPLKFNWYLSD